MATRAWIIPWQKAEKHVSWIWMAGTHVFDAIYFTTWCLYWCPTAIDEVAWLCRWVLTWKQTVCVYLSLWLKVTAHLEVSSLKEAMERKCLDQPLVRYWPGIWDCPSQLPPLQPKTLLTCFWPCWLFHPCGCNRTTRWWRTSQAGLHS